MANPISLNRLVLAISFSLAFPLLAAAQLSGPILLPPSVSAPEPATPETLPQYDNTPAPASQAKPEGEVDPEIVITPKIQVPTYRTPPSQPDRTSPKPQIQSGPQIDMRTLKPEVPPTYKQPGSVTPQLQPDPIPPQPARGTQPTASTNSESSVGGTWAEPDYWIVSSRQLPQSPGEEWKFNGQPPELDYIHFDKDRTFRRYTREKYQQWFSAGTPTCMVVHGSFTSWESLRFESGHLYHWFKKSAKDQPLQVVFFTWPSSTQLTGLLVTDVELLGNRASYNARYLQSAIMDMPPTSPVTLFGHSHGARMLAQTVQNLALSSEWTSRENQADLQLIFVAAAFDHFWLQPGQRNDRVVQEADRILNMKNGSDLALAFYSIQGSTGAEPLGRIGFTPQDRQLIGAPMNKVQELDLAPFIGTAHLWSHFYQRADLGKYVSDFVLLPAQQAASARPKSPAPTPVNPSDAGEDVATHPVIPRTQITNVHSLKPVDAEPTETVSPERSRLKPFAAGLPMIRGRRPLTPAANPNIPRKW